MHWVKRGPEPEGLERIRARHTPRWTRYYGSGHGAKPSDSKWRDFSDDLANAFHGLCGYCEETCRGEVTIFVPSPDTRPRLFVVELVVYLSRL